MAEFAAEVMSDERGYLTNEQVNKIISATTNLRDRLMLQLMYRCGRRVSEVLMLRKDDILWKDKKVIFTILKRKKSIRELKPVDDETFKLLKSYVEGNVRLLRGIRKGPTEDRLFPVSRQYVFKLMRKLGKKVGIERIGRKGKGLHPHHLRHSFAIHQVKTRVKTMEDLRKLQRFMSHANVNTTAHYLQYSSDDLRDIVDVWNKPKKEKVRGKEK